jgi:AhpD family alkylhydroperoxidase
VENASRVAEASTLAYCRQRNCAQSQDSAMTTRVPPVAPGTRPELAAIEAGIRAERGHVSLLYQVLLNSAPLAEGWEKLLTAVRNRNSLPADLREMVMLRVAVLNRAPFEMEAHRPLALRAGVSEAKIDALHAEGLAPNSRRPSAPSSR